MTQSTSDELALTAAQITELREQVDYLTRALVTRGLEGSTGCPPALTDDQLVGDRAAFKFRYLSSLMTAVNTSKLIFTVERYGAGQSLGLRVMLGQGGPSGGAYLAGAGTSPDGARTEFSLALDEGGVTGEDLRYAGVDVTKAFEQFVLRSQVKGPMLAVAPELPAVPSVTVIREGGGGLIVQRCAVQGGTYLVSIGEKQNGTKVYFEIALSNDTISARSLQDREIDVSKQFQPFALHQGDDGPVVAIAPGLT
jgi:hypothetical protein